VLLVNGDSFCDWPFGALIDRHLANGCRSTLLLTSWPDPADFGGGVGTDREGTILSFRAGIPERGEAVSRHAFAGAHVFSPELVAEIKPGNSDIVRDLYVPMLAAGAAIGSLVDDRPWHDMGTPRRFLDGTLEAGTWISPEADVDAAAAVLRSSIEAGATVAARARVEGSVLLPGARVGRGSVVRESIVGFGAVLAPGTRIERQIAMPGANGGTDFTPFDITPEG
jgi:mannose-1-phosphate guanylyltransferase